MGCKLILFKIKKPFVDIAVKAFGSFFVRTKNEPKKVAPNSCVFLRCLAKAGAELEHSASSLLLPNTSAQL